ncbi:hypothetical protein [Streptomyces sp. NPDC102437]|uniref:hypothetical protein n=1 Tax=Streptomyces sp. NPDC102437 TaxID=3366175 RepID=UPI003812BEFF
MPCGEAPRSPPAVGTCAGLPDSVRELLPSAEDLSRIADGVLNTPQTADRVPKRPRTTPVRTSPP